MPSGPPRSSVPERAEVDGADRHRHREERQRGQRDPEVGEAHEQAVEPAAVEARQRADDHADERSRATRHRTRPAARSGRRGAPARTMSRLRRSVPNQWAPDGPDGGSSRCCRFGSSARSATPTKQARNMNDEEPEPDHGERVAAEPAPRGAPLAAVLRGPHRVGARAASGSMASARARPDSSPIRMLMEAASRRGHLASSVRTAHADARVERGVQDVGEQVEHARRTPSPPPSTPGSPGSRTVRARRRTAGPRPGQLKTCSTTTTPPSSTPASMATTVTNGIERVAQRVPADDLASRHALRLRRAHVVGVQHVEHAVALVAAPRGDAREHEHRAPAAPCARSGCTMSALLARPSTCPARRARGCRAARAARRPRTSCSSSAKKKSGIEKPKYENDVAA